MILTQSLKGVSDFSPLLYKINLYIDSTNMWAECLHRISIICYNYDVAYMYYIRLFLYIDLMRKVLC